MRLKSGIVIAALIFEITSSLYGQFDCTNAYAFMLGSPTENERGHSLVAAPQGNALYISGSKADSALIIKMLLDGTIEWVRTFDIVPGADDQITGLLIDSEGMIIAAGLAGVSIGNETVFAFKYNPNTNSVLWAHSYYSTSVNHFAVMIELSTGNYLLSNSPQNPGDSELIEINRTTGLIVGQATHYHLGNSETIYDMILHQGKIYAAARFTDGGGVAGMRNTLLRIDPQTHAIEWVLLGHRPIQVSARLYTVDLIIHDNQIVSIVLGNETGTDINNTLVFIQKHTLDGDLVWIKRYNLPVSNDWVEDIIEVDNGYIVMGRNRVGPSDIILFKTDYDGNVIWAKSYDFRFNDTTWPTAMVQSQIARISDYIYFTAYAEQSGNSDLIIARVDLEGNLDDTCTVATDINIAVSDVVNPVFYSPNITVFNYAPVAVSRAVTPVNSMLEVYERCIEDFSVETEFYEEICAGETYEGYHESGTYIDIFVSSLGCDSIRTLHLTVTDPMVYEEYLEICTGESYAGYTESGIYIDTLTTSIGCDSIRVLHLSVSLHNLDIVAEICSGTSYGPYTESGIYVDTLPGINNTCDTLRRLELIVLPPLTETLDVTICAGESIYGYDQSGTYVDTLTNAEGCDSIRTLHLTVEMPELNVVAEICAGSSYGPYTESGIYMDILPGTGEACDTIRTLDLTVLPPLTETLDISICPGETLYGYHESGTYIDTLSTILGCDSIRILYLTVETPELDLVIELCAGSAYGPYTESGVYIDTLPGINNACDTIRTLELIVLPPLEEVISLYICAGDSVYGYHESGSYIDTLLTSQGCDSIRTLHLTVDIYHIDVLVEICSGDSYGPYSESGIYRDTLTGMPGACDTIRTLDLTVLPLQAVTLNLSICEGDTIYGYSTPGTYIDTLTTTLGCDSIRTLYLTSDNPSQHLLVEICSGSSYLSYTETGTYLDTIPGLNNACDTLRTLVLTVLPPAVGIVDTTICEGDFVFGYSQAGTYIDTLSTSLGCDSIRTLHLTIGAPEQYLFAEICSGSSYLSYTETGVYVDTLPGLGGACDTVRTLELTILPSVQDTLMHTVCEGETIYGYSATGVYVDTLTTMAGCDSIRVLHLEVGYHSVYLDVTICSGMSFESYTIPGIYLDTIPGLLGGCDTFRTLAISVLPPVEWVSHHTICAGDSYQGYTSAGIYTDTLITASGCDSIRVLHLTVWIPVQHITAEICAGESLFGHSASGVYIDTIPGVQGACDTIRTLSLHVSEAIETSDAAEICAGMSVFGYSTSGMYIDTLAAASGCDSIRTLDLVVHEPALPTPLEMSVCDNPFGYLRPGEYVDTLVSDNGCDSIVFTYVSGYARYIPNVFSPNADGINDFFEVYLSAFADVYLEYFAIFDRFGGMVYETKEWPVRWDGRKDGVEVFNPGVFAYVFIYICNDRRIVESGDVTLLR
jgi:gliding motility-associated-like protein